MKHTPHENLALLIHDSARLIRREFESRAVSYGLSSAQWRLLFRLGKEEGTTQARLAEFLEIEPISVSRLIDRMEQAGWIERRQDLQDRRVRQIHLTAKAREAFGPIRAMTQTILEDAVAGLPAEDRAAMMRGLNGIVANLSDGTCNGAAQTENEAA